MKPELKRKSIAATKLRNEKHSGVKGSIVAGCNFFCVGYWTDPDQGERLNDLVRKPSKFEYAPETPLAGHTARIQEFRLESILGRKLSNEEIRNARELFEKALTEFVRTGADLSFHPLSKLLEAEGQSMLFDSIVEDLYKYELSRMAKDVSSPLADSFFRSSTVPADSTVTKLAAIAQRPVFSVTSLPVKVRNPSYGARLSKWVARGIVRESGYGRLRSAARR